MSLRHAAVSVLLLALVTTGFTTPATAEDPASEPATASWDYPKPPKDYNPPTGVRLNDPLGTKEQQRVIRRHLNRAVDSTPGGARIELMSWNIRDAGFVDKLVAAHKRGVTVRVLIARRNWNPDNPNADMRRLADVFAKDGHRWSNSKRAVEDRSRVAKCRNACRGNKGYAHGKYFLFSHLGRSVENPTATDVVMHGSANATIVATNRQWNDLHTQKNRAALYGYASDVFDQAEADAPAPYTERTFGKLTIGFLPWTKDGDLTLKQLKPIKCRGTTGGTGVNGRTSIRVAMTAVLDERGVAIAKRLRRLWNDGCNIRIVYGVMGNQVLKVLRSKAGRGRVPIRQIAQDWEHDGVYDRYLHTKYVAISGVYGNDTSARVSINGSMNWTAKSLVSDETVGVVFNGKVRKKYAERVNRLFNRGPHYSAPLGRTATGRTTEIPGPDRYHGIEP